MGKYMKKSKITGDIAVMELSASTFGVLTRAKTLALKRLLKPSSSPRLDAPDDSSFCYLQLRSRRLEKPPPAFKQQQQHQQKEKACREELAKPKPSSRCSGRSVSLSLGCDEQDVEGCFVQNETPENNNVNDLVGVGIEASFGENSLDFEPRDRSTRESTPCSLIRGSDTIGTPGSTTRRTSMAAIYHGGNDMQRIIPTTHEMEEFFACAEQNQQRLFIEKYNFDIVNDLPLPGRYEWMQAIP